MSKVEVNAEGLHTLYAQAKRVNKLDAWAELALDWADAVDLYVKELEAKLAELEKAHE